MTTPRRLPHRRTRRQFVMGLAVLLVGAAAGSGCGNKGDLYLPQEKLDELKKKRASKEPASGPHRSA